ncbi:transmembrane protein, putative (macronuclear) [Tetrahymena thermophila SB210]|uniref:Transmembrane protein, putative n=1 Tax=Tetrahymena thermophila (strain SB210) TaxID=312017 RepID=I7M7Y4_TETTS|nr:transmembrane protein, putative [Tetrahymena thermophila SB210]EAR96263.1 transmembrane protein, putative [Tetrahymena thermophila SB210]|eukprot:XP_001016508.1 transmembrane protein, putative [Tetrahymena thermophila SB210]
MVFYKGEKSQLHESYLLKNNYSLLLAIRLIIFIYVHFLWWCQIYDQDAGDFTFLPLITNLKYLTLCGANLVNLYFLFTIIDMIRFKITKKTYTSFWQVCHFLFQISFSVEITIFLLYWIGVYPSVEEKYKESSWYMFTTASYHGGFFFCTYIEFFINNIAFKWKHYIPILIASIAYLIDNLIVTLLTKPVYKVMSWVSIMSYVFAVAAILVTFLHFCLGKYLYEKFKHSRIEAVNNKFVSQKAQVNPEEEQIKGSIEQQIQMVEVRTQSQKNINCGNSQESLSHNQQKQPEQQQKTQDQQQQQQEQIQAA